MQTEESIQAAASTKDFVSGFLGVGLPSILLAAAMIAIAVWIVHRRGEQRRERRHPPQAHGRIPVRKPKE